MDDKRVIFFRNDDVGLYSDRPVAPELVNMTGVFMEENIPVSHGVVPAAVSMETVEWLMDMKARHPGLIGIDQHGYRHVKHRRGEFGGRRGYDEQKSDISAGMELMEKYFGGAFSGCFSAPWVCYNSYTKRICDELGFKVFSGGVSPKFHARVFNGIGRTLNLNVMGGKEVSFHGPEGFSQAGFDILEISAGVDLMEDYRTKTLKTPDAVRERFEHCRAHSGVIGFLLHQWAFDTGEKLNALRGFLMEFKRDSSLSFKLIEDAARPDSR